MFESSEIPNVFKNNYRGLVKILTSSKDKPKEGESISFFSSLKYHIYDQQRLKDVEKDVNFFLEFEKKIK